MTTYTATYDFASSLAPTVSDPAFTASSLTKGASASSLSVSGGTASADTGITSATANPSGYIARQLYVDLVPASPLTPWTPGTVTLRASCNNNSQGNLSIRTDADSYAASLYTVTLNTTLTTRGPVSLASVGTITGPLRLAFWFYSSSTTARLYTIDDIVVTADFSTVSVLAIDPATISSTAAVGSPSLVSLLQIVSPATLAAVTQFGSPSLAITQPVVAVPAGIPSTVLIGAPSLASSIFIPVPSGADVAYALGAVGMDEGQADQHAQTVAAMARAFCRGNGFIGESCHPAVAAVILAGACRMATNPGQLSRRVGSVNIEGGFQGWSLAERAVLVEFRGVAA